ncbi:MAG: pyruvate, phosphate dikinase [Candidatus Krumholzibacteria bacterium]|nr:pyruvate, phosphate dikinase [Candidatus Krumholzibacteria bacterium]MDP6669081.1 pyruvate, phosphate dikinase [Candidatus Krumholzibacteria bacterium]MDP7021911.1 pyruvate, phosphate dikinase [Candidatus Krumholzibacteria bacterium]
MKKMTYVFGGDTSEGNQSMKNLLGGKGANLAEMSSLGIPVPAGFTITTEVCNRVVENKMQHPEGLQDEVRQSVAAVEKIMGGQFGDASNPLLLSVRSGARVSMPGMMDTVLNLGLNEDTLKGLIERSGNERFAYDSYRRFIQMYGDVVLQIRGENHDPFEQLLESMKESRNVSLDTDLSTEDLKELVAQYKALVQERKGEPFPDDPWEQLWGSVNAVFQSWGNPRAMHYRKINGIPHNWGTAVNVQAMVFGNMGETCATGVAFTRDPSTGEKRFYGEFLVNAQGEDVVAGIRTPQPINIVGKDPENPLPSMEEEFPEAYQQLVEIYEKLEDHYRDMQDIEFTVQDNRLWMLQTRSGKRTGFAAVRIAAEMLEEGLIDEETAVLRVDPDQLTQLLLPVFDLKDKERAVSEGHFLARGLNAGPGAATGALVLSAEEAVARSEKGEKVVLVRIETSPEDIQGMFVSQGILTSRGGMTSHAAVVARGMGKSCVAGCGALDIDYAKAEVMVAGQTLREGDAISIDGMTGEVFAGSIEVRPSEIVQVLVEREMPAEDSKLYQDFDRILALADGFSRMKVRTNADSPMDSGVARNFGASGIGLCRTEHMFFEEERIDAVREMILSADVEGRRKALDKILPMQQSDFEGIFRAMDGLPVTIRALDPPLHEFLPHSDADIEDLAGKMGVDATLLKSKVELLTESNPMLGHRGCRLGISYPEVTAMQARAILQAAVTVASEGVKVFPEIMIPLVGHVKELALQRKVVEDVAAEVFEALGRKVDYLVGTMIELPRAALTADEIAEEADFFSFGTNDLTQTALGLSRDDSGRFLPFYVEQGIYSRDPFAGLDQSGVGQLVAMGVEKGRSTRSSLKVGICGEHGGDPESVRFCHDIGLDYVSCSPYRVPVARLAAAHAALEKN